MTPTIDVRYSFKKWEAVLASYKREIMPSAVMAINRTTTSARAEGTRLLSPLYPGLKIGSLKARMKIIKATRSNPSAKIVTSGSRIDLFGKFGMRQKGRFGVRFGRLPWRLETLKGEVVSPEILARAFHQAPRGRELILARQTKNRYPIDLLLASSPAEALRVKGIRDRMQESRKKKFEVEFDRLMRVRISRRIF